MSQGLSSKENDLKDSVHQGKKEKDYMKAE